MRTVLAAAAHHDFELNQIDVEYAFLNGDLEEDIHMSVFEGINRSTTKNKV